MALNAAASTTLGEAHSRPFLAQILVPGTTVLGQEGYHDSVMVDLSRHMSTTPLHASCLLHTCHCYWKHALLKTGSQHACSKPVEAMSHCVCSVHVPLG